ncbi:MAG: TonB family protein [Elusimicrobia bacterium]|nr:TonB family protein [Elusimicrobiota bacterium]
MTASRVPVSVMSSLALHAAGLGLYLHMSRLARQAGARVIANVDLMIETRRPVETPKPIPRAPSPPSTWNFLKLALPAAPKAAPQALDAEPSRARAAALMAVPKLEERSRRPQAPAELPRLEDVGRRRPAGALQGLEAASLSARRRLSAAPRPLVEAAPERGALRRTLEAILPVSERLDMAPQMREAPEALRNRLEPVLSPAPQRGKARALEENKGVEIEGPLSGRKVLSYVIPEFPAWARDLGVHEASLSIRFDVSPQGAVLPQMLVERTSGFGRLDRLALEALRQWRFAPLAGGRRQWGIITFRFLLE